MRKWVVGHWKLVFPCCIGNTTFNQSINVSQRSSNRGDTHLSLPAEDPNLRRKTLPKKLTFCSSRSEYPDDQHFLSAFDKDQALAERAFLVSSPFLLSASSHSWEQKSSLVRGSLDLLSCVIQPSLFRVLVPQCKPISEPGQTSPSCLDFDKSLCQEPW